jgi:hypothetical protein
MLASIHVLLGRWLGGAESVRVPIIIQAGVYSQGEQEEGRDAGAVPRHHCVLVDVYMCV